MSTTPPSDRSTTMILEVGGQEIRDIKTFSYTSDVTNIGDPFACEIPDPRGIWSKVVSQGAKVQVYLSNPDVNGGKKTPKLRGRIITAKQISRPGTGDVLQVMGKDLGWHLSSSGPVFFNLQRATLGKLLDSLLDKSWGFQTPSRFGDANSLNRQVKLGRAQKLLQFTANNEVPLQYIGIEPGESVFDVLSQIAKFAGLLINVSADGYLQAWNPDYNRAPDYGFEYHPENSVLRVRNNIDMAEVEVSADKLFTKAVCVGEVLMLGDQVDPNDPHPGKKIGVATDQKVLGYSVLPFKRQKTYIDQEQFNEQYSRDNAEWTIRRAAYDAFTYTVHAAGHHQNGVWYDSDTIASINDTVHWDTKDPANPVRIQGNFYVGAVTLSWDPQSGGGTQLTLKRNGLLVAPKLGRGGIGVSDRSLNTLVVHEKA